MTTLPYWKDWKKTERNFLSKSATSWKNFIKTLGRASGGPGGGREARKEAGVLVKVSEKVGEIIEKAEEIADKVDEVVVEETVVELIVEALEAREIFRQRPKVLQKLRNFCHKEPE